MGTRGVFRASEAMQPPPRQEVLDREAINRFIRDNKAQGGRVNLQDGLGVMTLDPFKPTTTPTKAPLPPRPETRRASVVEEP